MDGSDEGRISLNFQLLYTSRPTTLTITKRDSKLNTQTSTVGSNRDWLAATKT